MAVQRDKIIASAEKLVGKAKIEPAIKEYERLLEDNPNDVNTLNRIGDLWVRINRNDEAVKVFGRIAEHYSRDGFFLKAIAIYKKINKLDPSKLEIYARLADLYAKQGLAMEAKSQYQVLADYYLKHGEPANALGIYKKISELDPSAINVHVKLADLYSQNGQTAEALKEYDRVGKLLLKRGMLDEAVQVFRKAVKIDAKNIDMVESLATALADAKDFTNAGQIIETALESNPDSARLMAMLGRVQVARGDLDAAQATLGRAHAADPNDGAVREALADIALRKSDPDRALTMLTPVVEKAIGRGDRNAAVEMLNRILRVDAGHAPTLDRLVTVYGRLNEETNVLAAMNSLAEAHMAKGRHEEAAVVLERLLSREPQNQQHRTKLQFVRSQMSGAETMPGPTRSTPLPSMEIEEPPPSFELTDEPALSLDLDDSEAIALDFSSEPQAAPVDEPPADDLDFITEHLTEAEVFAKYGLAEKAMEHLRAVIERSPRNVTALERLYRIQLDESDVDGARITGTHLSAVLEQAGDGAASSAVIADFSARGHELTPGVSAPRAAFTASTPAAAPEPSFDIDFSEASDLGFDMGAAAAPIEDAPEIELETDVELETEIELETELEFDTDMETEELQLATAPMEVETELSLEIPEQEFTLDTPPDMTLDAPVSAGFTFDEAPADGLTLEPAPEPLVLDRSAEESPSFEDAPAVPELTFDEAPASPELSFDSATEGSISFDDAPVAPPLSFEDVPAEPAPAFDETPATPLAFDDIPEETLSFDDSVDDAVFGTAAEPATTFTGLDEPAASAADELFDSDDTLDIKGEPAPEELGEIDFYIAQELNEEARVKLDDLLARYPANDELLSRQKRIAAASIPQPLPAPPVAPPPPSSRPAALSRDEIENELLSAIPDDDDDLIVPTAAPAPLSPFAPAPVHEENLFADEEDFFDLAAELEAELAEDEPLSLSEEEQSLEQIFKEFKKGVEQQLDSEDYDTHYNLGIAYKEMGLIDEAIGEFQLASKDPKRSVECASMLGLCFLEKGMPQLAIKWYRKGLEMPEITEDEQTGLLYDLGSAQQEVGDTETAQKTFMEVYGMNTKYRDVVSRIKMLEDARK